MKKRMRESSIETVKLFFRYGAFYLFIFMLFLFLLLPIYNNVYKIARRSIVEESYRKLHEGVLTVDGNIQRMTELAGILQGDEKYVRLSGISGSPDTKDYYTIRKLQEELIRLSRFQDVPLKFFILFNDNPIVLSDSMAATRTGEFYGKLIRYENMEEGDFYGLVSRTEGMKYIPEWNIRYLDGKSYDCFSYILKMPLDGMGNGKGNLVLVMDREQLLEWILPEGMEEDSFFYIMDKRDGTILMQNGYEWDTPLMLTEKSGEYDVNGRMYTVLSDDAQYSNLRIVVGIQRSLFQNSIQNVTAIIQVYIKVAILLFLAGCIWLAVYRIMRIKDLLTTLPHSQKDIWKAGDYNYIKKAFSEINRRTDSYAGELKKMKGIVSNNILEKLFVRGIYSQRERLEVENLLGHKIEFYCVVSINWECDMMPAETELDISKKISVQTGTYLENNYNEGVITVNSGLKEVIILLPLQPEDDSYTDKISRLFEQVGRIMGDEYGVTVSCGISDISMDIYNIHAAYLQAKTAARQNSGSRIVNEYDAIKSNSYVVDFQYGAQLYELIVGGEAESISLFFDKLKKQLIQRKLESEDEIKHLFYLLRDGLYHAKKMLPQLSSELPAYDMDSDVIGLLERLQHCAEEMCGILVEKKKRRNPELKTRIVGYIKENYANPDLGAWEIAEACGISEKYLYQFVKEQTGRTVGELLENIRMSECESLLMETDKSVTEICTMVGFHSNNTFYKAFKRVYGIAPGKWRENRQRKQ
ncbi:hypothetical protein BLA28_32240 [Eisenbergiella tayi]|uniref:Melibiose operon regulatory protein n=1 Tax=Eisenbergiella tayi TaxID=1432052 RepID=A0A1E3AGJ2_9FIRM|nr:helix-turn-helix domain-containing protein [Eisenbergiella tayi]ODM07854.1 Melibiose operon regulatory protein [Eisenbergiella tayi]OIZ59447.1 hypothetical protein BLA28_32240 [Eisenbergiella tayi]